jgi:glycosyltransferase involved in cell wall biosynthesis
LQAFAQWRARTASENRDVHLVLAGGKGWFYQQIFEHARGLGVEDVVHFPGFIPAAELPAWYRAALAFVYPSRFEGFGLPVAEAMASGAPVITSRAPSLLEVVADAALTFPTEDHVALADCIELMVGQSQLRAQLVKRGLARASLFTWHNTARQTLSVYDGLEAGSRK